jgi:hypothetical protein
MVGFATKLNDPNSDFVSCGSAHFFSINQHFIG